MDATQSKITCGTRVRIKDSVPVFGGRLGTVKWGYLDWSYVMYYHVYLDGGVPNIIAVEFQSSEIEVLTSGSIGANMSASPH